MASRLQTVLEFYKSKKMKRREEDDLSVPCFHMGCLLIVEQLKCWTSLPKVPQKRLANFLQTPGGPHGARLVSDLFATISNTADSHHCKDIHFGVVLILDWLKKYMDASGNDYAVGYKELVKLHEFEAQAAYKVIACKDLDLSAYSEDLTPCVDLFGVSSTASKKTTEKRSQEALGGASRKSKKVKTSKTAKALKGPSMASKSADDPSDDDDELLNYKPFEM